MCVCVCVCVRACVLQKKRHRRQNFGYVLYVAVMCACVRASEKRYRRQTLCFMCVCVCACVRASKGTEDKLWLCFVCAGNVCMHACFRKKVQKTNFGYVLYVVVMYGVCVCAHMHKTLLIIIFKKWYLPTDFVCVWERQTDRQTEERYRRRILFMFYMWW